VASKLSLQSAFYPMWDYDSELEVGWLDMASTASCHGFKLMQ